MKIFKYTLGVKEHQQIVINNCRAKPLSVAVQDGRLVMWVEIYENCPGSGDCVVDVQIIPTGEEREPVGDFLGTAQMTWGYVCHVYVRVERKAS